MYPGCKRLLDLVGAILLILLFSPLMIIVGVLIFCFDGRPVFFRQVRPGVGEIPFLLVKFRTMSQASAAPNADESARVTKFGSFLRKSSIDELPTLWNVARGDMSFVGPRPLLMEYVQIYSPVHSLRHSVRPGLTGLAQVTGRNLLSWKERLDLDVEYVRRKSLLLDIQILFKTIVVVFSSRGINQLDGSTMTRLTHGYDAE